MRMAGVPVFRLLPERRSLLPAGGWLGGSRIVIQQIGGKRTLARCLSAASGRTLEEGNRFPTPPEGGLSCAKRCCWFWRCRRRPRRSVRRPGGRKRRTATGTVTVRQCCARAATSGTAPGRRRPSSAPPALEAKHSFRGCWPPPGGPHPGTSSVVVARHFSSHRSRTYLSAAGVWYFAA